MRKSSYLDILDRYPDLLIRRVRHDEIDKIFDIHKKIISTLADPGIYRESPLEHFESHIVRRGITLGVFKSSSMIAYAILSFPECDQDNLGLTIGLRNDELMGVVHFEECAVMPEYRGIGIHKLMSAKRTRIARELGYRRAFVTVSPENYASLRVQFQHNFFILELVKKYGGFPRFVMYRDLTSYVKIASDQPAVLLDGFDPKINSVLKCGYLGVGMEGSKLRFIKSSHESLRVSRGIL